MSWQMHGVCMAPAHVFVSNFSIDIYLVSSYANFYCICKISWIGNKDDDVCCRDNFSTENSCFLWFITICLFQYLNSSLCAAEIEKDIGDLIKSVPELDDMFSVIDKIGAGRP